MKSKADVRAALTGPIPTIRTPYLENGEIDYNGLKNMIDFDIQVGGGEEHCPDGTGTPGRQETRRVPLP